MTAKRSIVHAQIDPALHERLVAEATEQRRPVRAVVEEALAEYLPPVEQDQSDTIAAIRRLAYDECPAYRAFIDAACERGLQKIQNQTRRQAVKP